MLEKIINFLAMPVVYNALIFILIISAILIVSVSLYGMFVWVPNKKADRAQKHLNYRLDRYTNNQ